MQCPRTRERAATDEGRELSRSSSGTPGDWDWKEEEEVWRPDPEEWPHLDEA